MFANVVFPGLDVVDTIMPFCPIFTNIGVVQLSLVWVAMAQYDI